MSGDDDNDEGNGGSSGHDGGGHYSFAELYQRKIYDCFEEFIACSLFDEMWC